MKSAAHITRNELKTVSVFLLFIFFITIPAYSQNSILELAGSAEKKGDQLFLQGSFQSALEEYYRVARKGNGNPTLNLKIARAYFRLNNYESSLNWYRKSTVRSFSDQDLLQFAEALAANRHYKEAIEQFKSYKTRHPEDELVQNKIWRLQNIQYLYEDSSQYSVNLLPVNSSHDDLAASPFRNGFVFLSNRVNAQSLSQVDGTRNASFFKLYYSEEGDDKLYAKGKLYRDPVSFSKALSSKYHNGPLVFYSDDQKVVFTVSSTERNKDDKLTLQLMFGEREGEKWKITQAFPYNSPTYSITDPTINNEGTVLYFTSDMKGGFGGKDLYRSKLVNGKWTTPENLGEPINTRFDECFPFLEGNHTLYFASNGHAGLGGLDIYKTALSDKGFSEITNMGYPVNTHADDFALVLNRGGYKGFVTSNRRSVAHGDDLYTLEIDQQSYPLALHGNLKIKEESWVEGGALNSLAGATLFLIDHTRDRVVYEYTSDSEGKFALTIPYFSIYKIKVVQPDGAVAWVSLEIPRQKKETYQHEIVIVRDAFKQEQK